MENHCPLCGFACPSAFDGDKVACPRCGEYRISVAATNILEYRNSAKQKDLLSGMIRRKKLEKALPCLSGISDIDSLLAAAPTTVAAKLDHLLGSLHLMTKHLGHEFDITSGLDYPLGCFGRGEELNYALQTLNDLDLVTFGRHNRPADTVENSTATVTLKFKAFEKVANSRQPLRVFISSTCYDLLDVRFELAQALETEGHIVRQSDCEERFDVDGTNGSIDLCLKNLERCDLMVLIVSRRYGGLLKNHTDAMDRASKKGLAGISATHLELFHARDKQIPVLVYVRDRTEVERPLVQGGNSGSCRWLQFGNEDQEKSWLEMMKDIQRDEDGKTMWVTQFSTVVDLKKMVRYRVNNWVAAFR